AIGEIREAGKIKLIELKTAKRRVANKA
ncbi:hypothetical protein Golob_001259, partial [Gossypium lobatum]|nr:hypothetical protein [Gossypium lobatum]